MTPPVPLVSMRAEMTFVTASDDVVAFELVEFNAVKFWRDVEP